MQLITRIIVAIVAVWLIVSFLLPFLFAIVAFPAVLIELIKIGVVLWALWFCWKGGFGL